MTSWKYHCLAYYHKLTMMSSKHEYVLTSLKNGESIKIKMSANRVYVSDTKEEEMVRRVGGRGRGLVQAVLRIRRETAGRAPQNLEPRTRAVLREADPCGQEGDRRLGGLQARERQNQTIDSETVDTTDRQRTRPRTRARMRARPNNPLPHQDFPIMTTLLLWGALWLPTDALIVKLFLTTYSPYHPTPLMTLTLCPIMMTCFHLVTPHSLTLTLLMSQFYYITYPFHPLRSTSSI